jgi:hypothetical protein
MPVVPRIPSVGRCDFHVAGLGNEAGDERRGAAATLKGQIAMPTLLIDE